MTIAEETFVKAWLVDPCMEEAILPQSNGKQTYAAGAIYGMATSSVEGCVIVVLCRAGMKQSAFQRFR